MTDRPVIVVTGGAGFIGSHMVDRMLRHDYRVRIIDNLTGGRESNLAHLADDPNLSLEVGDILDLEPGNALFADARYVFHFAGIGDIVPSIERPTAYMDVNVQGTVRVLECARHAEVDRLVYAASSSCYGLAATPTDENHPITPQYPYALSKYLGEMAVMHWGEIYHLPVNAIRIFNAYGPRVRTTGAYGAVFGVFFKQKLEGRPFTVVGDGTQSRDFIFVTDIAEAFGMVAEANHTGEIYNLGAGSPQSVNKLVELLGGEITYIPNRPGEPNCTWANIDKIQDHVGWRPTVSFADGVKEMTKNIEAWRDAPLWTPDSIAKATQVWFKYLTK